MAATRLALSIQSDRQEKVSWGTPAASLTATTELLSIYCILEFRGSVHVFGFSQEFFLLVFFHRPSAFSISTAKHWLREMFSNFQVLIFHVSERTGEFSFQCVGGIDFIIFGNALVVYVQLYAQGQQPTAFENSRLTWVSVQDVVLNTLKDRPRNQVNRSQSSATFTKHTSTEMSCSCRYGSCWCVTPWHKTMRSRQSASFC